MRGRHTDSHSLMARKPRIVCFFRFWAVMAAMSSFSGTAIGEDGAAGGFTIAGCVNETRAGGCTQTNVHVLLDPLGRSYYVGSSTRFQFDDIPPGEYILSVPTRCNPFGCWPKVAVTVSDADVFVSVPILPFCVGDCNRDLAVSLDELILGVNMALRGRVLFSCRGFDPNTDAVITVDELIEGVDSTLHGCPQTQAVRSQQTGR